MVAVVNSMEFCCSILKVDTIVCFKRTQAVVNGKEETAVEAIWVTDGIDHCCVGFLPCVYRKHTEHYNSKIAQVTDFLESSDNVTFRCRSQMSRGIGRATIIGKESLPESKMDL